MKIKLGIPAFLALGIVVSGNTLAGKIPIRVATWDSGRGLEPQIKVAQQYMKTHPGVTIKFEGSVENDKILASLLTGTAPDIFLWWDFPPMAKRKGLLDLTGLVKSDPSFKLTQYYKALIPYNSIKGKLVALPNAPASRAMYYNKTMFAKAGLQPPKPGWTWNEALQMAKKMTKESEKVFGMSMLTSTYPLQGWVWSNGGDFISKDGDRATGYLDSAATVEAVKWFADLRYTHKVAPPIGADLWSAFKNGKLGMMDDGTWPVGEFNKIKALDYGISPQPTPSGKKLITILHTSGWCMASQSKHKKEAWSFLKILGGEEQHRMTASLGWGMSGMPHLTKELKPDEKMKVFYDMMDYADVEPCFLRTMEWNGIINPIIQDSLDKVFAGKKDAASALKEAAANVDRRLRAKSVKK